MPEKLPVVAMMYDFDKTLSTKDMQEYSFIPKLGLTAQEFWEQSNALAKREKMDRILAYMYMMVRMSQDKHQSIRREDFAACAQLQKKIDSLMELYDIGTPFIPIMKRAMQLAGLPISDRCTPPFLTATPEQEARIRQVMERAGLLG